MNIILIMPKKTSIRIPLREKHKYLLIVVIVNKIIYLKQIIIKVDNQFFHKMLFNHQLTNIIITKEVLKKIEKIIGGIK